MLKFIKKDITTVEAGWIIHGVNCQHAMGSGVALAIKTKWPIIYKRYMEAAGGQEMLGKLHPIQVDKDLFVVNGYTQEFFGSDRNVRYADPDAISTIIKSVVEQAQHHFQKVYVPRIGCDRGGLQWETDVEPGLQQLAIDYPDVNIYVCDLP